MHIYPKDAERCTNIFIEVYCPTSSHPDCMKQAIVSIIQDGIKRRLRDFHLFAQKIETAYWEIQDNSYQCV